MEITLLAKLRGQRHSVSVKKDGRTTQGKFQQVALVSTLNEPRSRTDYFYVAHNIVWRTVICHIILLLY